MKEIAPDAHKRNYRNFSNYYLKPEIRGIPQNTNNGELRKTLQTAV